MTSEFSPRLN